MKQEIDIVDIKVAARNKQIRFYVSNNIIYVMNYIGEVVKVGEVKERVRPNEQY